jgi:tripartite-type tricarboxylate transporter receptor subunit TctC
MKMMRWVLIGMMTFGFTLLGAEKDFAAEKYPTKPINMIIAFQPGDTDINLRPFIEKMPDYLGQPMTFIYKPGFGGALGAGFVVASKPDGSYPQLFFREN